MKSILLFPVYLVMNAASIAIFAVGTLLDEFGKRLLESAAEMNALTPEGWWYKATQERQDSGPCPKCSGSGRVSK